MRTEQGEVYISEDGLKFLDREACLGHEATVLFRRRINAIMDPLGDRPDDRENFSNGRAFVQRHGPTAMRCARLLMLLAKERGESELVALVDGIDNETLWSRRWDIQGERWLEALGQEVMRAWTRLRCIDDQFREWDQPYFAFKPERGKQVEWTP